jgi:enamine deaminase RidA (YjgF/YER057c/UK114 family)
VWRHSGGEHRSEQFQADQTSGNLLRSEYFKRAYPSSTLVEVKSLVLPDVMSEIEAIAVAAA